MVEAIKNAWTMWQSGQAAVKKECEVSDGWWKRAMAMAWRRRTSKSIKPEVSTVQ